MIVIAMGYSGTGSSAVVHLLREYENCEDGGLGAYEHVPFYAPHGLFDLEDAILNNNSIYRSDAAINDFYAAMKRLNDNDFGWIGSYKSKYGDKFMEIVDEFVNSLIEFTRPGGWSNDIEYVWDRKKYCKDVLRKVIGRPVPRFGLIEKSSGRDGVVNFCLDTPTEFYAKAKKFVRAYFEMISNGSNKTLVIDQILQPQHLKRLENYFDNDVRCIIVDRDPRDMFVLSKYIWSQKSGWSIFPCEAERFCNFYTRLLNTETPVSDSRILRIHFEDLVYNYSVTVGRIEDFIGKNALGKHEHPQKNFVPSISIKNTQNFRIKEEWFSETLIIEKKMKDRIYNFPFVVVPKIEETSDPV